MEVQAVLVPTSLMFLMQLQQSRRRQIRSPILFIGSYGADRAEQAAPAAFIARIA
jgi:hypothetical protein